MKNLMDSNVMNEKYKARIKYMLEFINSEERLRKIYTMTLIHANHEAAENVYAGRSACVPARTAEECY